MTTERLDSRDRRLMLAVLMVIVVSTLYVWWVFSAAFPQASIDLRYSRDEITLMAERFVKERGLFTKNFRNLTLFDPDHAARFYLEREVGLEQANRLMQGDVSVWRWRARWFRPPEQEEMAVFLSPDGRLVGYEHEIAEAAPGARLGGEQARALAEQFLAERTSAPHRLIEVQLRERPNRHDHVFTWEQEGFRVKEATYRRTVVVQGGTVGSYEEFLHVPESWKREFSALRSRNELFAQIAQAFYVPLILASIFVLIQALRRRQVRWRPLILISGAIGALMVITEWNTLPFFIDRMPTSTPLRETVAIGILQGLGAGVGVFFYLILAAAAGEPLYRSRFPFRLALPHAFTRQGIRTKEFFVATVTGYGFAAAHIAFVAAFYLVGQRFGVWSPQDVPYSDLLSTVLPWTYPLTISLMAAFSEEFWFRLLAIPLLLRFVRFPWIAVVIPAFVWGFLHANYPQQPGYIRGIEVGVIGVAAGYLMLRFGILATLVWHYTVDAVLIGLFLFQSESWYFRLSGAAVAGAVLFPLAASVISYRRHGGFLAEPEILNRELSRAGEEERLDEVVETAPAAEPVRPAWPAKWLYAAALLALAVGTLWRPTIFGGFLSVRVSPEEAAATGSSTLRAESQDPEEWRRLTEFLTDLDTAEFEYIRRQRGAAAANEAVQNRTTAASWRTRFFQPLRKEEYHVYVDLEGRAFRIDRFLDEKAPGANLSQDEARRIADRHLAEERHVDVGSYRLVDANTEKKDHRTDHHFAWEATDFRIGEATARVAVSVLGEKPSHSQRFLKLPEEWLREFRRPRLQKFLVPALAGAVAMPLLIVLIRRLSGRSGRNEAGHRYRWRAYLLVTAAALAVAILAAANRWPTLLAGYDTATPLENYLGQALIGRLILILLIGVGAFLGALAVDVFLQLAVGDRTPTRPCVGRSAAAAALLWGLGNAFGAARQALPGPRDTLHLWGLTGPDTAVPGMAVLADGFFSALFILFSLAILVSAAARFVTPDRRRLLVVIAAAVIASSRSQHAVQGAFEFGAALVWVGVAMLLLRTCGVDLVGFFVALFWLSVAGDAVSLAAQPEPWLRWNGVGAAACAAVLGVGLLAAAAGKRMHLGYNR